MKKPTLPFAGTGWLRASFRAIRKRLFQTLLNRFIPGFDPFRLPFVVPMRPVSFSADPSLLFGLQDEPQPLPLHQPTPQHAHASGGTSCVACQRCASHDDVAIAGDSLDCLPSWRYN